MYRYLTLAAFTLASTAFVAPSPASASYLAQALRMGGTWNTPYGKLVIDVDPFEGALTGRFYDKSPALKYQLWWATHYSDFEAGDVGRVIDMYLVSRESSNDFKCRLFTPSCQAGRVNLRVSRDGRTLTAEAKSGAQIGTVSHWTATRETLQSPDRERMAKWVGDWDTTEGRVTFEPQGAYLVGTYQKQGAAGTSGEGTAVVIASATGAWGAWDLEASSPRQRGRVDLAMAADGQSFTGTYYHDITANRSAPTTRFPWTGKKAVTGTPEPSTPTPTPSTPPVVTPPAPLPPPATSAAYKPLRRVDVRLDRVVEARGYPTRQVHAFVTLKNISPTPQYISSGYLRAVLTDADGVAQERNQVWHASSEPAALFNSTPVVQPGAELKIRYVFNPNEGSQPATLTLSEGDKRAEFSTGGH